jgi:hypothetical protein
VFVVSGEVIPEAALPFAFEASFLEVSPPPRLFSSKDVILRGLSVSLFQGCESKRVRFTAAILQFYNSTPLCELALVTVTELGCFTLGVWGAALLRPYKFGGE